MIAWIKKHDTLLTLLLVLAVMAVIFFFSSQNGAESKRASGSVISTAQEILDPLEKSGGNSLRSFFSGRYATVVVRKTAHILEYAMLGFSLLLHFHTAARKGRLRRPIPAAFLTGVLYGASDELHQASVVGRKGSLSDVGIDSVGVALGLLLMLLVLHLLRTRRCRKEASVQREEGR